MSSETVARVMRADPASAPKLARALVASTPGDVSAIRLLAASVRAAAKAAERRRPPSDPPSPELAAARSKLEMGEMEAAEILVRERLKIAPRDYAAMNLLADIATRCGFVDKALLILKRATIFDPMYAESWANLGRLLHRQGQLDEALQALDTALACAPDDEATLSYKASMLVQMRRLDDALAVFEKLVEAHPSRARGWTNYAFVLKTVGRSGEAFAAYRTAIALEPANGAAWWGYANLKLAPFLQEDLAAMADGLAAPAMETSERCDLHFAYARALDRLGDVDAAAEQLALGNSLRKSLHPYDRHVVTRDVDQAIAAFTPSFFAARRSWGSDRPDPIFILGMPRSGSTLVEQILASHPSVEGTEELFGVQQIQAELDHAPEAGDHYPASLSSMPRGAFAQLGARYLAEAARFRRTRRPFFTDKMPGNWAHLGLIHLMLPRAKVIDVRRDPRDCCFANYAQHFLWGMNATYDQVDIASYYRDYVRLMRHFDTVLPGRVHRIVYEAMVDDLEGHVRALLDHLELPFDPACLRFFETDRPVHTPSAQQVKRPVNRDGIGRWKAYSAQLGPMLSMLGDLPDTYFD